MKIHHVGYLVRKMDRAIASFKDLGYQVLQDVVRDTYRKIDICFMEKDGCVVELVSPAAGDSDVSGLLRRVGNSPYHICYETGSFDEDLQALLDKKCAVCSPKHEAVALQGRNVCFLMHPHLGMIELLEV